MLEDKSGLEEILEKINSSFGENGRIATQSEIKERDQEIRKKTIENDVIEDERSLKKEICSWVIIVVSAYLITIGIILFIILLKDGLDSSVIIALLTTTTINILGLPWLIIQSLFPSKKEKN